MKNLNIIFKFLSSIKLSVPVMIALLIASIAGTLAESNYNAEYASLTIYKTWWFMLILFLLWINILFAALSRLPWKKRHIGFVVTHLGMLMLLVGSVLTMWWGIDGTMQIYEKSESNVVFLQNNVLEYGNNKLPVKRYLVEKDANSFDQSFSFKIEKFLPYVDVPQKTFSTGDNLNFKIKSPFFDVVQVLNTLEERETQMGPAVFRIVNTGASEAVQVKSVKKEMNANSKTGNFLYITDQNGKKLKESTLAVGKKIEINNAVVEIKNVFGNAQIINNKIQDGGNGAVNPAVELIVTANGKTFREIVYKNIPEFTLNPDGILGMKFSFNLSNNSENKLRVSNELPANHPVIGGGSTPDRIKNTVEFKIVDQENVEVELFKNGESLMKQKMKKGELITTPWMGIELTFLGVTSPNQTFEPIKTEPKRKMPLPPSALLLNVNGSKKWITENSEIFLNDSGANSSIYYGRERLFLPFSLGLEKFEKNDYPGSQMAMDYKSFVKINNTGATKEIYMNEPLKFEGYTFYQSSYSLEPNSPALTILSVNRDPGRELKYIGSIILCLGIIIYTLQKSKRIKFLKD